MNKATKVLGTTFVVAVLALSVVAISLQNEAFAGSAIGGNGGAGGSADIKSANGGSSFFGNANGGFGGAGGSGGPCTVISCSN